jgi:transposase
VKVRGSRGASTLDASHTFETVPGKQMQADFTGIRRRREPLLALVATMGYSRANFVRFTAREEADTMRMPA